MGFEDLFSANNWYTVDFEDAKPEILFTIMKYLGKFNISPGETPRTDGHEIVLSAAISKFEDPKEILYNNRNVSMYVADTCHEASHIIGGAFLVDFTDYFQNEFDRPGLAALLHNIIRDRSDEDYFKENYASENDKDLMINSNNYLIKNKPVPKDRTGLFLELYSAKVINEQHIGELVPEHEEKISKFLGSEVKSNGLKEQGINTLQELLAKLESMSIINGGDRVEAAKRVMSATKDIYDIFVDEFQEDIDDYNKTYLRGGKHGKGAVDVKNMRDFDKKRGKIEEEAQKAREEIEKRKKEAWKEKKDKERNSEFEFDYRRRSYSKRVKVYDKEITEQDWDFVHALERHAPITQEIIGYLMELKPNQLRLVQRTNEPDEINIQATIDVMADPSLRYDANVYDGVQINKREYAIDILIDSSGSTGYKIGKERVIDIEKSLAGILYNALTEIGDKVKMYAYTSDWQHGRDTHVEYIPGIENLGVIEPRNANRDGAAIRRVTKHLLDEDARDRWLVIVADGKPNSTDYEGEYAVKDTAKAIAEAEEKNIRVIYLNVDSEKPDYFNELVGNATYARWFKSVKELPKFSYELVTEVMG